MTLLLGKQGGRQGTAQPPTDPTPQISGTIRMAPPHGSGRARCIAELTGPQVTISVDCTEERLSSSAAAMCKFPGFKQLGQEIEKLTKDLERRLSGTGTEVLLDTEGPFGVERNNCVNERPQVRECVGRVLKQPYTALNAAMMMPNSIRGEVAVYHFPSPAFVLKYGESLVGRRVNVFGCLKIDLGLVAAERLKGRVLESCERPAGPQVPVVFKKMDQSGADWYDDRTIYTHWEGTIQRESGRIILRMDMEQG